MEKNNLSKGPVSGPSLDHNTLWRSVERVRTVSPLVHNITNLVVTNNTANALLAVGASPIMAHAHSEVEAMVALCTGLVVNIGTLDEYKVESMVMAAREAARLGRPWVFDPVGAGATPYRDEVSARLLELRPTVIRGNGSEILSLARAAKTATKGVDSTAESTEAVDAARELNRRFGSIVCVSGATDVIVGGGETILVHNGNRMMTLVTGLGCSASAVTGAFAAVACMGGGTGAADDGGAAVGSAVVGSAENGNAAGALSGSGALLESVAAGIALFAIAGEIAAEGAPGPGTLQMALLDKLYNITEAEFAARLKIERL